MDRRLSTASGSLGARCALAAIRAYQRYISPHKGFSCALRSATGARSCSSYGYRAIARRRLKACGEKHRFGGGPLSYQQGDCDPGCDAGDVFANLCGCGCDLGSWRNAGRKAQIQQANDELERSRAENAKRKLAGKATRNEE